MIEELMRVGIAPRDARDMSLMAGAMEIAKKRLAERADRALKAPATPKKRRAPINISRKHKR